MEAVSTDFENWGAYQMKQFHIMYEKGERCDLEISCNKQIFLVHRLILSACSEYVRELGDKQHIILPDEVSCKALKSVIEFVYTGKISFCKDDKEDYLLVSNLLNMRLLTELIKMEESCSFTLSMEEETEKSKNSDDQDAIVNSSDVNSSDMSKSARALTSKKTEKSSKPKGSRNSVFPPMFRFPYLQNKLNMNRTYGLITTLTESIPSRFEISEEVLQKFDYQSVFEDVTYDTSALFVSLDFFPILQDHHRDFVRKNRDTGTSKRVVNVLFSFFDKYTPAYSANTDLCSRKREIAASFSCSPETPVPPKRNLPRSMTFSIYKNAKTNQTRQSRRKSVTFADKPQICGEKSPSPPPPRQPSPVNTTTTLPVLSAIETTSSKNTGNSFDAFAENDVEMSLPAPLTPVQNITGEVLPDDEKVELIRLNNLVTSIPLTITNCEENENDKEYSHISISTLQNDDFNKKADISHSENNEVKTTDTPSPELDAKDNMSLESTEIVVEDPSSKISTTKNLITLTEQIKDDWDIDPSEVIIDVDAMSDISKDSISPEPVALELTETTETNKKHHEVDSSSAIITPIDSVTLGDLPACPNSKMFAVKVKGTEDPTQLSKLVDLCKNNPLFKNKNVKFKIVPVKGPLPAALKESQSLSGVDKAIIVRRTATPQTRTTPISSPKINKPSLSAKNSRVSSTSGPPIDNIKGPWKCIACGKPDPLEFDTYYEFRLHFKDVHKQGINSMYCEYCGFKSMKRNMQVYHLYTKHDVKPPAAFHFPKCPICDYLAINDYFVQKHMSTQHATGEVIEYICSCKMAFKTSELLQQHMVSNDCKKSSSYTCGYCRSIFDRFVNLKAHMRVCMKERSKPNLQNAKTENGTDTAARGLEFK